MVLSASRRRGLIDPLTQRLWRFTTRDDAWLHSLSDPDFEVLNGWEKPDGSLTISTFGG